MIISFGDPAWQQKKIAGVELDKFVDYIKYTKEEGNKLDVLKKYTGDCKKVIFVDNSGPDVDKVGQMMPEVQTYFMNRVPADAMVTDDEFMKMRYAESRKMAESQVVLKHKRCSTLKEITL